MPAIAGRLVTVYHGVDVQRLCARLPRLLRLPLFARGQLFPADLGGVGRQELVALGCDPGRMHVHRMGVDIARYPFAPRHYRPDRRCVR